LIEREKPDLSNRAEWPDMVSAARFLLERIQRGDANAAQDAIRTATIGLREILAGRPPDPEQMVLVAWLEQCLTKVTHDHLDANRALGLVADHAPFLPEERDAVLCLWVHEELRRARYKSMERPLPVAFEAVAKRAKKLIFSKGGAAPTAATVSKAWKKYAAEKRQKSAR
jgi:hypothetical protein